MRRLAECDEPIAYFKGGFWTFPSIGNKVPPLQAPAWYTTPGTLNALLKRGLLKRSSRATNYPIERYPSLGDYVLSATGLALATGSQAPIEGLVEMVSGWFGRVLVYTKLVVLGPDEWESFLREQSFDLDDPESQRELMCNTSAVTTDDGIIVIRAGHETDALHELVHAAGVMSREGENTFICEGIAQTVTEELGRLHGIPVRKTYRDEVAWVSKHLMPLSGLSLHDLAIVYAADGLFRLAQLINHEHPDRFEGERDPVGRIHEILANMTPPPYRDSAIIRLILPGEPVKGR